MKTRWKWLLVLIDVSLAAYWVAIATEMLPQAWRFRDYSNPVIQAWNWSFLPLDALAVAVGFAGVYLTSARHPAGRLVLTVGLTLTFCAGLMAIAFWSFYGDFDLAWWAPNLVLMAVPAALLACMFSENGPVSPRGRRATP